MEEKTLRQQFLEDVDAFLALTGMSVTSFGVMAANNGKLIADMKKDEKRTITLETAEAVWKFMREYDLPEQALSPGAPSTPGGDIRDSAAFGK